MYRSFCEECLLAQGSPWPVYSLIYKVFYGSYLITYLGMCYSSVRFGQYLYISEITMSKPDPYAGIDFDELNDTTGLEADEIKCLKTCFDLFDSKKQDFLSADDLDEILRAMGFR